VSQNKNTYINGSKKYIKHIYALGQHGYHGRKQWYFSPIKKFTPKLVVLQPLDVGHFLGPSFLDWKPRKKEYSHNFGQT
jgi:hypothetical protein